MDFSVAFVELRDRMLTGQDKQFIHRQNAEVAGRTAALLSCFSVSAERKLLGVMPTGGVSHAHEYRLLFAVPVLGERELDDWWRYALAAEDELVQADASHEFSIVSVILATGEVDKAVQKKLKRFSGERRYGGGQNGWSSVRLAAVDLTENKAHTNRMGEPLKNVLKPILQKNT
ncbi:MAG: hypothetical protein Q4C72_08105 [Eubacteriales bacterium]|nr:hypothetical protein [Eubacteriales bacterium]